MEFRKHFGVFLPTKTPFLGSLRLKPKKGLFNKIALANHYNDVYDFDAKHLYVIDDSKSNNPINIGDWVLLKWSYGAKYDLNRTFFYRLALVKEIHNEFFLCSTPENIESANLKSDAENTFKIIASTDEEIKVPNFTDNFMNKLVERLDSTTTIDVLLGYSERVSFEADKSKRENPANGIIRRPYLYVDKENKVRANVFIENFSREEVFQMLDDAFNIGRDYQRTGENKLNEYKENL